MGNTIEERVELLEELANSEIIKEDYPMIEKIDIKLIKSRHRADSVILMYYIFLNDSSINVKNMYEKGLDPHYFIDFRMERYYKYFLLNEFTFSTGFKVYDTDLEVIDAWNV